MDYGTLKTQLGNRLPGLRTYWHKVKRKRQILNEGKLEGIVLMLHRIGYPEAGRLDSNEHMKLTPEKLSEYLTAIQQRYNIIPSESIFEYASSHPEKPFAVLTLDDAYTDNLVNGLPVFETYNAPFTIFAPTDYISGKGFLWWYKLEEVLMRNESLTLSDNSQYSCKSISQKNDTFLNLRNRILHMNPLTYESELQKLFRSYDEWNSSEPDLILNWQQLTSLSHHPLVTIGAHTKHHYNLKMVPAEEEVVKEIQAGIDELEEHDIHPTVFAYPYGSANEVSEREITIAERFGFTASFISYGDVVTTANLSHPQAIHRIMLDNDTDIKDILE